MAYHFLFPFHLCFYLCQRMEAIAVEVVIGVMFSVHSDDFQVMQTKTLKPQIPPRLFCLAARHHIKSSFGMALLQTHREHIPRLALMGM